MEFNSLRSVLAALLLVWLTGCATAPPPDEADGEQAAETPDRPPSALPEGPVTPNPYEQNRQPVSERARSDFQAALTAMEQENWSDAERRLVAMTEAYPKLSGPWVNLAKVHEARGRPEEAVAALERAIQINPQNLDAYNQLALIRREAGEFEAAERLYRQALAVWPFHARTHLNLGILLDLYRGEGHAALEHYRAYQQRQDEPDREVAGWIVDLERRLPAGENE